MNEQTLIRINAQLCINDRGCSDVNLNLSQSEALKVYQAAASSKGATIDYSQYVEYWSVAFFTTLSFWILAKTAGIVLSFFRR
ncbi:hypothetical protein HYE53_10030 [Aggregatibacter actinomycetemcomitans]|uniref:hypothetical protein n=1 Tax=Aggregatibacter actinomycetemcomitans TaxID=714 RepID=UPI00197C396F|nr:hypothetical protein [Aggregatibacter actinomycetemcomitans]MBN6069970.1 hypothetical protein [Aggregatibacter actinomycetemcomitans]MBN6071407.1 hypothetical protein [Aggregatibacter actinomycetemcomitans]